MIPQVIHYCWFGCNPLPESAKRCIASWKKYLPEYEIKEWTEDNFDIKKIPYIKEAYNAKKYAFVSDYARFWILYNYGGLYFDTDVEIIKPINDIVERGAFMGCESDSSTTDFPIAVAPGLGLGCEAYLPFYKEMIDLYETLHFENADGSYNMTTVVSYTTNKLIERGLKDIPEIQECAGLIIYPKDYFNPKSQVDGKIRITENTRSIHHFAGTWMNRSEKLRVYIRCLLGEKFLKLIRPLYKRKS